MQEESFSAKYQAQALLLCRTLVTIRWSPSVPTVVLCLCPCRIHVQPSTYSPSAPEAPTTYKIHESRVDLLFMSMCQGAIFGLMQGLEAGVHRQVIFTGLRVGLYGTILDSFNAEKNRDDAHLGVRVAAAMTTSALGITLANPSGTSEALGSADCKYLQSTAASI
jgi:hypothetical protein